jgi:hypothetical protein
VELFIEGKSDIYLINKLFGLANAELKSKADSKKC